MADGGRGPRTGRVTLVMGTDPAGTDDAYEEEISRMGEEAGRPADRVGSAGEAVRVLVSCGLFDPDPVLAVSSCSDALKASASARSTRRELLAALAANPSAAVVLRLGKGASRTAADDELVSGIRSLGGDVVVRDMPPGGNRIPWLLGYADRHGVDLSEGAARLVLSILNDGDFAIAAELVRSLGPELNSMSRSELLPIVPAATESTYTRMRTAVVERDAVTLGRIRAEMPGGPSGDRAFVTKLRYAVQMLLTASVIDWSRKDVLAHGRGEYGDRYASRLMAEASRSGGRERYSRAYVGLCRLVTSMTGFGSGAPPTPDDAILVAVS